jgi:phosphoglycerate dehydrogenase-like enzyme
MPRVLVTPHMLQRQPGPYLDILEGAGLEVVYPPEGSNTLEEPVIAEILAGDIDAMLAGTEPLNRHVLSQSKLKAVARQGVGYDSVDTQAATDMGIAVTITPGTLEASVAELTLGMLLALTRDLIKHDREVREGRWLRESGPRMAGKTFGIVGLGRIGRAVARRIQALEMQVLAYDPNLSMEQASELEIQKVDRFEDLLPQVDVLSLHIPCTTETRNLIDAAALKLMKNDAILLNLGRGGIVDEDALCDTLHEGRLFAAGLDVFEQEPLPLSSPLLNAPRLLLSSHMGGIDNESTRLASCLAARCSADLFQGKWPEECLVNPLVKPTWQWTA